MLKISSFCIYKKKKVKMADILLTATLITLIVTGMLKIFTSLSKRVSKSSCVNRRGSGIVMEFTSSNPPTVKSVPCSAHTSMERKYRSDSEGDSDEGSDEKSTQSE
jgi:hypothetical protein